MQSTHNGSFLRLRLGIERNRIFVFCINVGDVTDIPQIYLERYGIRIKPQETQNLVHDKHQIIESGPTCNFFLSYDLRTLSDNIDSHIKDIVNMVNLLLNKHTRRLLNIDRTKRERQCRVWPCEHIWCVQSLLKIVLKTQLTKLIYRRRVSGFRLFIVEIPNGVPFYIQVGISFLLPFDHSITVIQTYIINSLSYPIIHSFSYPTVHF